MLNNVRLKREEVDIRENGFFNKSYDHVKAIKKTQNFQIKSVFLFQFFYSKWSLGYFHPMMIQNDDSSWIYFKYLTPSQALQTS